MAGNPKLTSRMNEWDLRSVYPEFDAAINE